MADNVNITAGSGTTIAADDIGGVLHQRVKVSVGADGAASDMVGGAGAVSSAVPRVTLASDDPAVTALQLLDNAISGNEMQVDVLTLPNVTLAAGTNTNEIVGDVADDAVAAGNPVRVGGFVKNFDGTDPGSVSAEDDAASLIQDNNRRLYVNTAHPRFWSVSADYGSAQTNASVKAAPGASLSLYITDLQISNGATAGNITLLDGSGGTVIYELYAGINGGSILNLTTPIKLSANTALCITSSTVTTHAIFVSGYIAP